MWPPQGASSLSPLATHPPPPFPCPHLRAHANPRITFTLPVSSESPIALCIRDPGRPFPRPLGIVPATARPSGHAIARADPALGGAAGGARSHRKGLEEGSNARLVVERCATKGNLRRIRDGCLAQPGPINGQGFLCQDDTEVALVARNSPDCARASSLSLAPSSPGGPNATGSRPKRCFPLSWSSPA